MANTMLRLNLIREFDKADDGLDAGDGFESAGSDDADDDADFDETMEEEARKGREASYDPDFDN